MRGKLFISLGLAALIGALVMASLALARARANSEVRIHGNNGDFQGRVLSERAKCLGGRKVIVYRQKGNVQKPFTDQKIGSDITERHRDHGDWSLGNTGFKNGDFYAQVKRTDACKGDFSRTISL